jgi:lysozyme family protein
MNIIDRILLTEGGYVNDPSDAGGETKFGISKRAHPDINIKALTKDQARDILVQDYIIDPGFGDLTPGSLRDQLIDFGYHSGPSAAIRTLQAVLGVPVDGVLGPSTRAALQRWDPIRLNNALVKARVVKLAALVQAKPQNLKFIKGWLIRALDFLVV